jgi:hypothetical protein
MSHLKNFTNPQRAVMKQVYITSFLVGLLADQRVAGAVLRKHSDPQPFKIDLSKGVPRLLNLVNQTHLPANEEYPGVGETFGIDLSVLKDLQEEWTTDFDWKTQEASLNKYASR